jgi:lysophospholipid acyltransferase (LPLAT)-like uncharacterized protein
LAAVQLTPSAMTRDAAPPWTIRQRYLLAIVPAISALLIRLLALSLRFEIICEDGAHAAAPDEQGIWCFWHRCLLTSACFFRHRPRTALLISRSFDGELIARTIERLGFQTVRGSSSRGGARGLRSLVQAVQAGASAVFPADGPRGPRYGLKPGALKLAELTGRPVGFFYMLPQRHWCLRSWDGLLIPKPFTRTVLVWGPPMVVPPQPDAAEFESLRSAAESTLERLRATAEAYFSRGR